MFKRFPKFGHLVSGIVKLEAILEVPVLTSATHWKKICGKKTCWVKVDKPAFLRAWGLESHKALYLQGLVWISDSCWQSAAATPQHLDSPVCLQSLVLCILAVSACSRGSGYYHGFCWQLSSDLVVWMGLVMGRMRFVVAKFYHVHHDLHDNVCTALLTPVEISRKCFTSLAHWFRVLKIRPVAKSGAFNPYWLYLWRQLT